MKAKRSVRMTTRTRTVERPFDVFRDVDRSKDGRDGFFLMLPGNGSDEFYNRENLEHLIREAEASDTGANPEGLVRQAARWKLRWLQSWHAQLLGVQAVPEWAGPLYAAWVEALREADQTWSRCLSGAFTRCPGR